MEIPLLELQLGAERLKAHEVEVHRASSDGAPPGQRHFGPADAGEQRPQHQKGGPHRFHQLIWSFITVYSRRVNHKFMTLGADLGAQGLEDLAEGRYIAQPWDIAYPRFTVHQQEARHDRQGRILRAADMRTSVQRHPAFNLDVIHSRAAPHCLCCATTTRSVLL